MKSSPSRDAPHSPFQDAPHSPSQDAPHSPIQVRALSSRQDALRSIFGNVNAVPGDDTVPYEDDSDDSFEDIYRKPVEDPLHEATVSAVVEQPTQTIKRLTVTEDPAGLLNLDSFVNVTINVPSRYRRRNNSRWILVDVSIVRATIDLVAYSPGVYAPLLPDEYYDGGRDLHGRKAQIHLQRRFDRSGQPPANPTIYYAQFPRLSINRPGKFCFRVSLIKLDIGVSSGRIILDTVDTRPIQVLEPRSKTQHDGD